MPNTVAFAKTTCNYSVFPRSFAMKTSQRQAATKVVPVVIAMTWRQLVPFVATGLWPVHDRLARRGPPTGGGYRPGTSPETFHKVTQPVVRERLYAMIIAAGHGMVVDQCIDHCLFSRLRYAREERVH